MPFWADELLIRPTHDDRAGAGSNSGRVPLRAPKRANQFVGHALATSTSLRPRLAEPVDQRLTVSLVVRIGCPVSSARCHELRLPELQPLLVGLGGAVPRDKKLSPVHALESVCEHRPVGLPK